MSVNPLEELVKKTGTYNCLDCGVCTGSCPVARVDPSFSPRLIVERSLMGLEEVQDEEIWSCLACARCSVRCPAKIDFPEFVRLLRDEATLAGREGSYAHSGTLQTIMALQTRPIRQDRLSWLTEKESVAEKGEYFYFVGCRPYFDVVFRYIPAGSIQGARNAIRLLNAVGIKPVLSNDERCCGHDALWNGLEDRFKLLAEKNLETIRVSGAKKVLFTCPEGYYTFKTHYPRYFGPLGFEVLHLDEFLAGKLSENGLSFTAREERVTYHDPCRLGRLTGVYDAPRDLIRRVPGLQLVEMERSRENGVCCGTTGWMNCSGCSRAIQMERLAEAKQTGASTLITNCPKCEIHFSCALSANPMELRVKDLHDLLVESISGK